MSLYTGTEQSAVAEVVAQAPAWGVPADLLLAVAAQEGHLSDPLAVQHDPANNANDYGIFNLNVPAGSQRAQQLAGLSVLQLSDPDLAAQIQGPMWRQAFDEFGGAPAWEADPVGFFEQFMPVAQGSVAVPPGSAPSDVQEGKALAGGGGLHFSSPAASGVGLPAASLLGAVGPTVSPSWNPFSGIIDAGTRLGVFAVAVVLVLGGFVLLSGHSKTVVQMAKAGAAA